MSRKTGTRPLAPTSALDHALDGLATNDPEAALRWAIPALADEGSGAAAADIVGRALVRLGKPELARDAFELAVALLVHQGLAPHAIASAIALLEVTGKDDAIKRVAAAFGAEAAAGTDARPPALKSDDVTPIDASVPRDKLISQAVTALAASSRPSAVRMQRPRLPLWGALPSVAFVRLARALIVRVCAPGDKLTSEGEPGESAFILARGEVRVTRQATDDPDEVELAVLGPGAVFGEMALVTDAPRAATVTATRGALVLEAPRAALDQAAAEVKAVGEQVVAFCQRRLVDNVMRTSAILREVPADEREGLAHMFETRTFEPGDALIVEGSSGSGLHLLAAGAVEVQRQEPSGEVLRIASLGPGTCVGEISLVLRRPATASVVATQPAVSLVLGADKFLEVIKDRPNLLAKLYGLAVRREDETMSVVGQEAEEIDDAVIV